MKSTNSRGYIEVYMPRDKEAALNKLADLSAVAASREWERAALVALMVRQGKAGRPRKNVTNVRDISGKQESISEFTRHGVYGFRSQDAVRAYLKAWELGGMPMPEYGQKAELPKGEFPDIKELYTVNRDSNGSSQEGRPIENNGQEATGETQDSTGEDEAPEDMSGDEETPEDTASPRRQPTPHPHRQADPLDGFLKVLDRLDPTIVVAGQSREQIDLLTKTLESWLESLKDAASEIIDDA